MKIIVHQKDLRDTLNTSQDQLWRSLEHFLNSHSRDFVFNDFEKTVEVEVSDKSDAVRLMSKAAVGSYEIIDNGSTAEIQVPTGKPGRPKNTVFDSAIGKSLSAKQYQKHLIGISLSKAEVVMRGILTKSQLEKAVASGDLNVIKVGASQRILSAALRDYMNKLIL